MDKNMDELARQRSQRAQGATIRSIGQEIGEDFKTLTDQHIALLKKESANSAKKITAAAVMAALGFFLAAFGIIRLVEAFVGFVSVQLGWTNPNLVTLLSGIVLVIFALILALIGKSIATSVQKEKSELIAEMKEDWKWLKRIVS
ncbi:MAG: phage holin family protein [Oligoflexus sp.]